MKPNDTIWYRIGSDSVAIPWASGIVLYVWGRFYRLRVEHSTGDTNRAYDVYAKEGEFVPRDPQMNERDRPDSR